MTQYEAKLLEDAKYYQDLADAQAGRPGANEQDFLWYADQAAKRLQAAASLVWTMGPDGRHAFVAHAGIWPYIGGRPRHRPPPEEKPPPDRPPREEAP